MAYSLTPPEPKTYIIKHWLHMPIYHILTFAGVIRPEDRLRVADSASDGFRDTKREYHAHKPQMSLAALFWGHDLSQMPECELITNAAALMELVTRENRLQILLACEQPLRHIELSVRSEIKNIVAQYCQITETSTFSDVLALWAIRKALLMPSSLTRELTVLNKDETIKDINSERFSNALADALSVMAWKSAAGQPEAQARYKRACGKIAEWNPPALRDFREVTALRLHQAVEFMSVVITEEFAQKLLVVMAETAIENKKITLDQYECLHILYISLSKCK